MKGQEASRPTGWRQCLGWCAPGWPHREGPPGISVLLPQESEQCLTVTHGTAPQLPPGEDWALSLPKPGWAPEVGGEGDWGSFGMNGAHVMEQALGRNPEGSPTGITASLCGPHHRDPRGHMLMSQLVGGRLPRARLGPREEPWARSLTLQGCCWPRPRGRLPGPAPLRGDKSPVPQERRLAASTPCWSRLPPEPNKTRVCTHTVLPTHSGRSTRGQGLGASLDASGSPKLPGNMQIILR